LIAGGLLAFSFADAGGERFDDPGAAGCASPRSPRRSTRLVAALGNGPNSGRGLGVWAMCFLAVTILGASLILGKAGRVRSGLTRPMSTESPPMRRQLWVNPALCRCAFQRSELKVNAVIRLARYLLIAALMVSIGAVGCVAARSHLVGMAVSYSTQAAGSVMTGLSQTLPSAVSIPARFAVRSRSDQSEKKDPKSKGSKKLKPRPLRERSPQRWRFAAPQVEFDCHRPAK